MSVRRLDSKVSDKLGRFRQVMKKRWLSVIIGIFLTWVFLIVRISLAENLIYLSDDIYILGCEIFTEVGPKFKDAAKQHEKNLQEYKTNLKRRASQNVPQRITAIALNCPGINWLFRDWDKYTAEKAIDEALRVLRKAKEETDQRNIVEDIWEAGDNLLKFREEMISFRRAGHIGIGFYKSTGAPKELRDEIIPKAIYDSQAKFDVFIKEPSWQKAWALCEANRKTTLMLFLVRSGYKGEQISEYLEAFRKILDKSHEEKENYAKTLPENSSIQKLVYLFAESDKRRLDIVEALQNNNMDKARYLVWQAKERAKRTRSEVLDMLQTEEFKLAGKNLDVGI